MPQRRAVSEEGVLFATGVSVFGRLLLVSFEGGGLVAVRWYGAEEEGQEERESKGKKTQGKQRRRRQRQEPDQTKAP